MYLRTFLLPRFSAPSVAHPPMCRKTPPVFWYAADVMNPCLSFGYSPWPCLGGKGLALELVARSHWLGRIRAAKAVLLTAGLSREEVDGVVQKHGEGKLSSSVLQCSNLLPFSLLFSHMGAPVVANFSFQHSFASPYSYFICVFCAVL